MKKDKLLVFVMMTVIIFLGAVIHLTSDAKANRGTIYVDDKLRSITAYIYFS